MSTHISKLCSSAFFHLHNISRIRKFLSPVETKSLVHAFVTSRVDYCNSLLYGLPASQLNKVQRVLHGRMKKPESGIQNRSRKRKRNRKRHRNPNPNIRNKNWRRFCLESITNNNCSINTFHPHIIFIYCYYIFYCRIFCVRRNIVFFENFIYACLSVATLDHNWHEYSSSLCRPSLTMQTMDETRSPFKKRYEWEYKSFHSSPFYWVWKNVIILQKHICFRLQIATKRRIDWNVSTFENVKLLCLEFMLESAAEQHGLILWILVGMLFFFACHFPNVSISLVSRSLC